MRTRSLTFGMAVAVGLTAATVTAGQGPGRGGQRGFAGGLLRMLPVMNALDANGDGEISAAELDAAPESLARLDDDRDGRLSSTELQPTPRPGAAAPGAARGGGRDGPIGGSARSAPEATAVFMAFDANADGALDRTELPSQHQSLLTRADANGDDAASRAEILAVLTTEAGSSGRGPGRAGVRGGAARGGGRGPARMLRSVPLMAALDADGDGTVSPAEITSAGRSLASLDTNGDGRLTPDELRPDMGNAAGGGARRR